MTDIQEKIAIAEIELGHESPRLKRSENLHKHFLGSNGVSQAPKLGVNAMPISKKSGIIKTVEALTGRRFFSRHNGASGQWGMDECK